MSPRATCKGTTIVELLVYFALAGLVLTAVAGFYWRASRVYGDIEGSFKMSDEIVPAVTKLRSDLRQTALHTVVTESNKLAMISALDDNGSMAISPYGVPQWSRDVYYAVQSGDDSEGELVRWEEPLSDTTNNIPLIPTLTDSVSGTDSSLILSGVLKPGYDLARADDGYQVGASPGSEGGFTVRFVRRSLSGEESLSPINPASGSDQDVRGDEKSWAEGITGLVQVDLKVVTKNEANGKLDSIKFSFRTAPRH